MLAIVMHLIWRLFAAYVSVNTQEYLAFCFCLKIPKLEPQLWNHWAMSKHRKSKHYSLLFGEREATLCFCHPPSTSRGCPHRIAAQNGRAPRDTEFPPEARCLHPSHALSSRRAMSVLHCLRKESLGVLQLQSLAQVREAKDTAWNVPWIKQRRMGPQKVNITHTHTRTWDSHSSARNRIYSPASKDVWQSKSRAFRALLLLFLLFLCERMVC